MRDYLVEGVSSALTGLPIYHAEIRVLNADTTPAQLYSDAGVTPLAQPVLTDGLGTASFFVADGTYTLVIADPGGANARSFPNTEIYEDARNVSVPIGEAGLVLPAIGARMGRVLGFDSSGLPLAFDPFIGTEPSVAVAEEALLRAIADSDELARATGVEGGLAVRLTAAENDIDGLQGTITSGRRAYTSYASAVADAATPALYPAVTLGTVAEVPLTDAGTHTDPVVGGTVNNSGIFRWSVSPAGWQRISDVAAVAASGYATAAAASATTATTQAGIATAAAASIVTPTAISGSGAPGINVGHAGDTYYDTASGLQYQQKTAGTWPRAGVADANAPWSIYDFRYGGTFPSFLTMTRAGTAATDLTYGDATGRTINAFAANAPIIRTDKGLGIFPHSKNWLLNSTGPANHTTASLPIGKYIFWGNGTGTVTLAANTAVGTGFGTFDLNTPGYQIINISSAGTVDVSKTGTVYAWQLESNVITSASVIPTPLIVTAGAAVQRNADEYDITGAFLAAIQASAGTLVVQPGSIELEAGFTRTPTLIAVNGRALLYAGSAAALTLYDGVNIVNPGLGTDVWSARVRAGYTWSGVTVSVGAGNKYTSTSTHQHNNGVAVTAARIGSSVANTFGNQTLGGWIERFKWRSDRLSDDALFADFSSQLYSGVSLNV